MRKWEARRGVNAGHLLRGSSVVGFLPEVFASYIVSKESMARRYVNGLDRPPGYIGWRGLQEQFACAMGRVIHVS